MKSIYTLTKEKGLIVEEKVTQRIGRDRAKVYGYMWGGKKIVTLKDGVQIGFLLWHHFDDPGGDWNPSEEEMDNAWSVEWVLLPNLPEELKSGDCYTRHILLDEHLYCYMTNDVWERVEKVKEAIQNNIWPEEKHIHQIF